MKFGSKFTIQAETDYTSVSRRETQFYSEAFNIDIASVSALARARHQNSDLNL